MPTPPPVLLLDVDGVLNAVRRGRVQLCSTGSLGGLRRTYRAPGFRR